MLSKEGGGKKENEHEAKSNYTTLKKNSLISRERVGSRQLATLGSGKIET